MTKREIQVAVIDVNTLEEISNDRHAEANRCMTHTVASCRYF